MIPKFKMTDLLNRQPLDKGLWHKSRVDELRRIFPEVEFLNEVDSKKAGEDLIRALQGVPDKMIDAFSPKLQYCTFDIKADENGMVSYFREVREDKDFQQIFNIEFILEKDKSQYKVVDHFVQNSRICLELDEDGYYNPFRGPIILPKSGYHAEFSYCSLKNGSIGIRDLSSFFTQANGMTVKNDGNVELLASFKELRDEINKKLVEMGKNISICSWKEQDVPNISVCIGKINGEDASNSEFKDVIDKNIKAHEYVPRTLLTKHLFSGNLRTAQKIDEFLGYTNIQ